MGRPRFRRRRTGIWLPVLGRETEGSSSTTALRTSIALTTDQDYTSGITGAVPVLLDTPRQRGDVSQSASMGDILTNEYFLQRVVGDIYAEVRTFTPADWPDAAGSFPPNANYARSAVILYAGMCVARADDLTSDTPLGITTDDGVNYQVDGPDNARQPWLWRRSWVLQPWWVKDYFLDGARLQNVQAPDFGVYPQNNFSEGQGLYNGPRIDQKTKRRVRQEDRLWLIFTARAYPAFTARPVAAFQTVIDINSDLRCFGALRRARNSGQYA